MREILLRDAIKELEGELGPEEKIILSRVIKTVVGVVGTAFMGIEYGDKLGDLLGKVMIIVGGLGVMLEPAELAFSDCSERLLEEIGFGGETIQ